MPLSDVHDAFGSLHVPSQVGPPLPPSQNGGRHIAGTPGRGPTQVQPGGQSPPQLGKVSPHGVLPAGRQPQLRNGSLAVAPHSWPSGHAPLHTGAEPPHGWCGDTQLQPISGLPPQTPSPGQPPEQALPATRRARRGRAFRCGSHLTWLPPVVCAAMRNHARGQCRILATASRGRCSSRPATRTLGSRVPRGSRARRSSVSTKCRRRARGAIVGTHARGRKSRTAACRSRQSAYKRQQASAGSGRSRARRVPRGAAAPTAPALQPGTCARAHACASPTTIAGDRRQTRRPSCPTRSRRGGPHHRASPPLPAPPRRAHARRCPDLHPARPRPR